MSNKSNSSSPSAYTDGGECSSSEDPAASQPGAICQEMMLQIQQMMQQGKTASLLQVVQLTIQHVEQRKEISKLQQSLKKALEERVQTKRDLIVQHNFKTNVKNLERQKQSASLRLREKLDTVNAIIKTNDEMRAQLKEDDTLARSEVDEILKVLSDITPKAAVLQNAIKKGEAIVKEASQQLSNAALEKAKLQQECRNKDYEMRCAASSMAETVQQQKAELADLVHAIQESLGQLDHEQQCLSEQEKRCDQLQSDLAAMQQNYERQKEAWETELKNKMQHLEKQNQLLDKQFNDMKSKDAEHIASLTRTLEEAIREEEAARERVEILTAKKSELESTLQNVNRNNAELEREVESCQRKKQQELELVRLKETAKANKATAAAAKEAPVAKKPNLLLSGRPKLLMFSKTGTNAQEQQNTKPAAAAAADQNITITSDSDLSCSFQNSVYFDGKY
ncbi:girdin-like [Anopheles gambiae]|uniref:girdin-like n=1 Tax=Anopheles gambiae TaxID=7165 RepID=UPI002AC8F6E7|nr:girdin-like [Anopheles gambiae]